VYWNSVTENWDESRSNSPEFIVEKVDGVAAAAGLAPENARKPPSNDTSAPLSQRLPVRLIRFLYSSPKMVLIQVTPLAAKVVSTERL
jgi:hypothetical protein